MAIRTIRNLEELESVRAYWEKWQDNPNSDFDHFRLICRLRSKVICPNVTVVEHDGEPCGLLVARLEHSHFTLSIGYLNLARIPAIILTVPYQGLIGPVDNETALALVQHQFSLISSGEAHAVVFNKLPENSQLLLALKSIDSRWLCDKNPSWSSHWSMKLPDQPGFLLKKLRSKHRSWIRKKQNQIESAFPDRIVWKWLSSFDNVPALCARLETVAAKTYQRGLGAGFKDDEDHRGRFALFGGRGQLRVQLLEIDGNVVAYWIGVVYRGVFHSWATGYDPDLGQYEMGTQVFVRMVDELVQEGVRKLDFGLGDAHYKQRFGDHSWRESTARLFAPTAKGVVIRCALCVVDALDSAARKLLNRAGFLDRLKTGWRRRLVMTNQQGKKIL